MADKLRAPYEEDNADAYRAQKAFETDPPVARVEQVGPRFCSICLNDSGTRRKLAVMTDKVARRLVCEDVEACRLEVVASARAGWFR